MDNLSANQHPTGNQTTNFHFETSKCFRVPSQAAERMQTQANDLYGILRSRRITGNSLRGFGTGRYIGTVYTFIRFRPQISTIKCNVLSPFSQYLSDYGPIRCKMQYIITCSQRLRASAARRAAWCWL